MTASFVHRVLGNRETRLRRRVERYNDQSFGPRTRATRHRVVVLGLAYATGLTGFVVVLTALLQGYLNLALSVPASLGTWWFWLERVRTSGRGLTELPPEVLDERQRSARAHAYERAYRIVVGAFLVLPVMAFIDRFGGLDPGVYFVVGLVGILVALAAPPVVLAWSEPSEESADQASGE